ncbi:MAG: tRNA uridine-5-carboxymethylaminomethyl(34) synthesis GTPase MnmE [Pseudomonadales bacterium]
MQKPRKPESLDSDTIAAPATAAGQAGVGIIRVSGPQARSIAAKITGVEPLPRQAQLRDFFATDSSIIDSGIVLYFSQPNSFTGEDVVELQGHGGPVVMQMLLDAVLGLGARLARPGEFTERAFNNGKLDLAQAEAVADLIASSSIAAARGASRSLAGEFSASVHAIDAKVVELRMFVEAAIDFPDDDIDLLAGGQVGERLIDILEALNSLLCECTQGILLRDGVTLALLGAPNVGKSSLLNALAGEARAIVTDIPGTTRDLVQVDLVLDGLPVVVVDTAGLRESADPIELEGVRRARREGVNADIVLGVVAVDEQQTEWSFDTLEAVLPDLDPSRLIQIANKIDLVPDMADSLPAGVVAVSALTGQGLDALIAVIKNAVGYAADGGRFTARKRHVLALEAALAAAHRCRTLATGTMAGELIAEELRQVHAALGDIVGEMTSDELLGEIFSRFCIGK